MKGKLIAAVVLVVAALLEVGGDALIRKGLRARGAWLVAAGFVVLGGYGVVVNLMRIDFGRLLGAYVGIFAVASVACGMLVFGERVAPTTWLGLGVILAGSVIIHFGAR